MAKPKQKVNSDNMPFLLVYFEKQTSKASPKIQQSFLSVLTTIKQRQTSKTNITNINQFQMWCDQFVNAKQWQNALKAFWKRNYDLKNKHNQKHITITAENLKMLKEIPGNTLDKKLEQLLAVYNEQINQLTPMSTSSLSSTTTTTTTTTTTIK